MKAQRSSATISSASMSNVETTGSPASLNSGMISSNKAITSALLWSPDNRCLAGTCQTRSRSGTILERAGDRGRARHPPRVVLGEVESVAVALQVAERFGIGAGVLA